MKIFRQEKTQREKGFNGEGKYRSVKKANIRGNQSLREKIGLDELKWERPGGEKRPKEKILISEKQWVKTLWR